MYRYLMLYLKSYKEAKINLSYNAFSQNRPRTAIEIEEYRAKVSQKKINIKNLIGLKNACPDYRKVSSSPVVVSTLV